MPSSILVAAAAVLADFAIAADNRVQIFVHDALDGQSQYTASVVNAWKDQTVYAIQCTSTNGGLVEFGTCGPAAPVRNLGTRDKPWNQKLNT